jgi:hypothetical protein
MARSSRLPAVVLFAVVLVSIFTSDMDHKLAYAAANAVVIALTVLVIERVKRRPDA